MTWFDKYLQAKRIDQARRFLSPGDRVLDIGSADGALFRTLDNLGSECLGIDPTLCEPVEGKNFQLLPGFFPQDMPPVGPFDAITMLAILEHYPEVGHTVLAEECGKLLRPGGRLIITVPSPHVDAILYVLKMMNLVHGMSLEEHYGYQVEKTCKIFGCPIFRFICRRKFQFGCNNLFVFEKNNDAD